MHFLEELAVFALRKVFICISRGVGISQPPRTPPASPRRVVHFFVTQYTGFFKELGKPRIFDGKFV